MEVLQVVVPGVGDGTVVRERVWVAALTLELCGGLIGVEKRGKVEICTRRQWDHDL
jgi:hypothetical protein